MVGGFECEHDDGVEVEVVWKGQLYVSRSGCAGVRVEVGVGMFSWSSSLSRAWWDMDIPGILSGRLYGDGLCGEAGSCCCWGAFCCVHY